MDKPNRAPHRKANFEIIIRSMSSSAGHKRKHSSDSEDDEETGSAMSQADNVDANETEVDEEVGATTQSQADEDVDATQGQTDDEDEQDTQQNEPHDSLGLVAPTTLADSFVDGLDAEAPIIESVPLDNTLPHLNAASSHVEAAALTLIATHNPIKRESSMEEIDLTAHVPESVPIPALPRRGRPRRQQPAPQHMAAAAAAPTAPAAPSGVPLHWPQSMPSAQFTGYAAIPNGQGLRHAMGMSNAPFSGHAMGMSNAQFFGHAAGIPNALFPGHLVEVIVGTQRIPFHVARQLLCSSSRRFATDLLDVRVTRLQRYQDIPADFNAYVHWLHHRTVPVSNMNGAQTHWMMWARLSALGYKLGDDRFQAAIIDGILYKYREGVPPGDYPGHEVLNYLWTVGRMTRGLTQLYMDIWAHWCSRRFTVTLDELKRLPAEFLAALYLTMSRELVTRGVELSTGFHLGMNREKYLPTWPTNQSHYSEDV